MCNWSEDFVKRTLPDVNLTLADNYDKAVDLIINNSVNAMIADMEICRVTILRNSDQPLSTLDQAITIESIGTAIHSNDFLLENVISNFYKSLEMVGALTKLELIWFENGAWLFDIE